MSNNWITALIVLIAAAGIITLLIMRNKKDKKNLLNKFTKTEEEGKIDANA
ncbi:MAG: hypothetical protein M3004_03145 [Bacteroidota bacterium]|nr:hypothetical protein [Bacteroidota bacterium]